MVTDVVRTGWEYGAISSLLQLDLAGAFDAVDRRRLLHTLWEAGFPIWVIRWTRTFLEKRTARMFIDGDFAPTTNVPAGVPQGSPLSPILFLLFITPLYRRLERIPTLIVVGFADDTNLLTVSREPEVNRRVLKQAWDTCRKWSEDFGMTFGPEKSALIHFTKRRKPCQTPVQLGAALVTPKEYERFLGVWLDRKLSWSAHVSHLRRKVIAKLPALNRLAAAAWGCSLPRAKQIYTAVIRPTILYGAGVWHDIREKPAKVAKSLAVEQSKCLRIVAGAYRATPIRALEWELGVPPLDLECSRQAALFEARIEINGIRAKIETAVRKARRIAGRRFIARLGRSNKKPPASAPEVNPTLTRSERAYEWRGSKVVEDAVADTWMERRRAELTSKAIQTREKASLSDKTDEPIKPDVYGNLLKHEASLLFQIRTNVGGWKQALFGMRVPEVMTPLCDCGAGPHNPEHAVLHCTNLEGKRARLQAEVGAVALRTTRDFQDCLNNPETAAMIVRWLLKAGFYPQYDKARKIGGVLPGKKRNHDSKRPNGFQNRRVVLQNREGAVTGEYRF
jgi:hypothetical protein